MKLLFATDRMHVPDDHSGSVQSTHSLVERLIGRGHVCSGVASLPRRGRHFVATALHRATGGRMVPEWEDRRAGYPVRRGSQWRFPERTARALADGRPDRLLLDSFRALRILAREGVEVPRGTLVFVHDPGFLDEPPEVPFRDRIRVVANSPWTAERLREHLGVEAAVHVPVVDFSRYRTVPDGARHATLVSPTPHKGVELILEVARRLPDVPFLLVEGWPMAGADWRELEAVVRTLPNVTLQRSSADIREVYRRTRVLLNPSVMETFGRVVVEAQVSGIPALVRGVGALPWVTGEGGRVLPSEAGAEAWAEALGEMMRSPSCHASLSEAAIRNAERPEFDPDRVVDGIEGLLGVDPSGKAGGGVRQGE